jgi:hypothetical protein
MHQSEFENYIILNQKDIINIFRKEKDNFNLDFSFDNFKVIDIALENNIHSNFFKLLYKRPEIKDYLISKVFLLKCSQFSRIDIIDFITENNISTFLYLETVLIKYYSINKRFDHKKNKIIRGIIDRFSILSSDKDNFQSFFDNLLLFLLSEEIYLESFLSYLENTRSEINKSFFINSNLSYFLKQIDSFSLKKSYENRIKNIINKFLSIEYLNKNIIQKYLHNELLYNSLELHLNSLINLKLRSLKTRENFEDNFDFFINRINEKDSFYILNYSILLKKSIAVESKKIFYHLVNLPYFKSVKPIYFLDILFLDHISKDFIIFIFNLNLFNIKDFKYIFIKSFENIYFDSHGFIYEYINDLEKFSKEENLNIMVKLFEKDQEYKIFQKCFKNTINTLNSEEAVWLINYSLSYVEPFRAYNINGFYSNYLLNQDDFIKLIKNDYKKIEFNNLEKEKLFHLKMNVLIF